MSLNTQNIEPTSRIILSQEWFDLLSCLNHILFTSIRYFCKPLALEKSMSSNTQKKNLDSPKGAKGCCLVQQVFAEAALDVLATVAYHHEAGDSWAIVNADLSILEVVEGACFHCCLSCWADIAFLAAADKENLSCVRVLDELKLCILADYKLTC